MYIIYNNFDAQVSNRDWGLAQFGSAKCAKNNWKMCNFALPIVSPGYTWPMAKKRLKNMGCSIITSHLSFQWSLSLIFFFLDEFGWYTQNWDGIWVG